MTEPRAVRIEPTRGELTFMDTTDYTAIKEAIGGGWLEGVATDGSVTMYCDDEGKLKGMPINLLATAFWTHVGGGMHVLHGDFLVGPIVVLGPIDPDGNETAVPAIAVDILTALSLMAIDPEGMTT